MAEQTVTKQLKLYFLANDISLTQAAEATGYNYKHFSNMLNQGDLSNDQRERIVKAYPETKPFMIPEWARLRGE